MVEMDASRVLLFSPALVRRDLGGHASLDGFAPRGVSLILMMGVNASNVVILSSVALGIDDVAIEAADTPVISSAFFRNFSFVAAAAGAAFRRVTRVGVFRGGRSVPLPVPLLATRWLFRKGGMR